MAKYTVKKEGQEWAFCRGHEILSLHMHKHDAQSAMQAQKQDDDRSRVMSSYNAEAESRALLAEFLLEFA